MTSVTKMELHKVLYCHQTRTELRYSLYT